ncbi:hypothetical protein ACIQYZ_13460 [Rhodococcus erythropolis]
MLLTTTQTADIVRNGLGRDGHEPSVFADKVVSLAHAGGLTNVGTGARYMFDQAQVEEFVERTRFVVDLDEVRALHPDGLVYRVSVKPRQPRSDVYHVRGVTYSWAGVDLTDDPDGDDELGGWAGVWPVNRELVAELIDAQALVYPSMRDYVGPDHIRRIVDVEPVGDRYFFVTDPAPDPVREWLGAGAWISTPGGPICALV